MRNRTATPVSRLDSRQQIDCADRRVLCPPCGSNGTPPNLTAQTSAIDSSKGVLSRPDQLHVLPRPTLDLNDQPESPESGGKPAVERPASHQRRSDTNG